MDPRDVINKDVTVDSLKKMAATCPKCKDKMAGEKCKCGYKKQNDTEEDETSSGMTA